MSNIITTLLPHVQQRAPVTEQMLQVLIGQVNIPHDYISLLRLSNGLEGKINEDTDIVLWEAESLITNNQEYHIEEFTPGCFLIGSDRWETAYGLDMRPTSATYGFYLSRPFISVGWNEVVVLGSSFQEFIAVIKDVL